MRMVAVAENRGGNTMAEGERYAKKSVLPSIVMGIIIIVFGVAMMVTVGLGLAGLNYELSKYLPSP